MKDYDYYFPRFFFCRGISSLSLSLCLLLIMKFKKSKKNTAITSRNRNFVGYVILRAHSRTIDLTKVRFYEFLNYVFILRFENTFRFLYYTNFSIHCCLIAFSLFFTEIKRKQAVQKNEFFISSYIL